MAAATPKPLAHDGTDRLHAHAWIRALQLPTVRTTEPNVAEPGGLEGPTAEEVEPWTWEGFRDRADDALTQGAEEVDERTGDRFDEQTDRAADEVRERADGVLDDQQADEPQQ
jgi:hypothetical protein